MAAMSDLRPQIVEIVRTKGYRRLDDPVRLASGEFSFDYVDAKRALARGADLKLACEALSAMAAAHGVSFDAVGGLTLGADQFAYGVSIVSGSSWFVVRKAMKDHGTRSRIEGAALGPGVSVMVVDDVATTGSSILEAFGAVTETGATVVFAAALVDRGKATRVAFDRLAVPYEALLTYRDLGIEPVGPLDGGHEGPPIDDSCPINGDHS